MVDVADLAAARGVYGITREKREAFLLEAGLRDREGRRVGGGEGGKGGAQGEVDGSW